MRKMRRRDKLAEVRKYIKGRNPVVAFYASRNLTGFGNIKYLRLMVIHDDIVTLLPCSVVRDQFGGVKTQGVLFSAKSLCRIVNGERAGMYIKHNRLRMGETASKAGLEKRLGRGPNSISASNEKDKIVIDRMYEAIQDPLDSDQLLCPSYYIRSARIASLTPRLEGHVTKRFMALDGYRPDLPFEDNFHNLVEVFSMDDPSSNKYKLYPLDILHGPGLMMFDVDSIPPPQILPVEALVKGYELTEVEYDHAQRYV
jgi:hypothetical protein